MSRVELKDLVAHLLEKSQSFDNHLSDLSCQTVHFAAGKINQFEFVVFAKSSRDVGKTTGWIATEADGDAVVWMAYPEQALKSTIANSIVTLDGRLSRTRVSLYSAGRH